MVVLFSKGIAFALGVMGDCFFGPCRSERNYLRSFFCKKTFQLAERYRAGFWMSFRIGGGAVKERPIIFSSEMVRAILDGRKTQTRRVVKPQPPVDCAVWGGWVLCSSDRKDEGKASWHDSTMPLIKKSHRVRCPYGQVGDRLWVREKIDATWGCDAMYAADEKQLVHAIGWDWLHKDARKLPVRIIPSIHMPRWASRITLEIVNVRVERLWDISHDDVLAEGIKSLPYPEGTTALALASEARVRFTKLWNSIHGEGSFERENLWLWVIEFKRV